MYFGEDDGSDSDQESTATTTKTKGVDRPQGGPHQKKGQKKGVRSVLSFRVSLRLSLCKSSSVSPVSVFLLLSRVSLARLLRKQLIMAFVTFSSCATTRARTHARTQVSTSSSSTRCVFSHLNAMHCISRSSLSGLGEPWNCSSSS